MVTQLEKVLLISLASLIGMGLLYAFTMIAYKTIWPHECTIKNKRQNNSHRAKTRFRIFQDKHKNWKISTPFFARYKINMPKPHEDYFEVIGKKSMYLDIIIPENGEPYCIKPNFDKLGQLKEYQIDNRDVIAGLKQELREGVLKYQFKNNWQSAVQIAMILAMVVIFVFGAYYMQKIIKDGQGTLKEIRLKEMDVQIQNIALLNRTDTLLEQFLSCNGGLLNPINLTSIGR